MRLNKLYRPIRNMLAGVKAYFCFTFSFFWNLYMFVSHGRILPENLVKISFYPLESVNEGNIEVLEIIINYCNMSKVIRPVL